ncbi:MAG: hypothetical protein WAV25_01620 [Minisyncoccia bacterium]
MAGRIKQFLVDQKLITGDGTQSGSAVKAAPTQTASVASMPRPVATVGVADTEYVGALREAMTKSTVNGFQEFQDQLGIFESVPGMDEPMRFRTAITALSKSSGIKRDQIVKASEDRLRILVAARDEFAHTIEERRNRELGSNEADLSATRAEIDTKRKEIQELEGKLQQLEVKKQTINQKLTAASTAFGNAYAVVEAEVRSFVSKLTQYLT